MEERILEPTAKLFGRWRIRIFFACWTMYASYYLARANLSLAQPLVRDDLNLTDQQMGWMVSAFMVAYGIGQLVNGILGDRLGARKTATVGMVVSAICNLAFGLAFSLPALLAFWTINGLAQSTGAPMRIKTLANWFPPRSRGKMMGLLGTDYQFGNLLCWLLVGQWILPAYGWRYAFFIPAGIFLLSALHFAIRVRNQPEDIGLPCLEDWERSNDTADPSHCSAAAGESLGFILRQSVGNLRVWLVGLAYFGVDLIRYGFLVWAPTFMYDQGVSIDKTALNMAVMPLAAMPGIVVSGWLSDRIGGRRAPVIAVMLFVVALLTFIYPRIPRGEVLATVACLAAIGFFLYGPHLLMGATLAIDLGSRKASGAASGLIDALGYAGAAVTAVGSALVKERFGLAGTFNFWVFGAVLAGVLMLLLWKYQPSRDRRYL